MNDKQCVWRIVTTDGEIRHFPSSRGVSDFMMKMRRNDFSSVSYRITFPSDPEALSNLLNKTVDLARMESQEAFFVEPKGESIND